MVDLIQKKRDGKTLNQSELARIINGFVDGSIPDYQVSAFLMAAYFHGFDSQETATLTTLMMNSGDLIDLSEIEGVKVDKHSTGGVGDKTTLVLTPLVAAAGVPVAKMSGRGLGHTGGTLDKLEAIDGFSIEMTIPEFINRIQKNGIAVCGQTANLVPADKKLYALRDVTATVNNMSLIASSIMSKKLACGADAIVIDIKVGDGAFMKNLKDAEKLGHTMIDIGSHMGRKVVTVLTDMEQPLGNAVGNALEVQEAIDTLKGHGPKDFVEICLELGGHMLVLGKVAKTHKEAVVILKKLIDSGKALEKFKTFVESQGGDTSVIDYPDRLPQAKLSQDFISTEEGYISRLNAMSVGLASMKLGAGRANKASTLDYGAGILLKQKVGAYVKKGDILAVMYTEKASSFKNAKDLLISAYEISDTQPIIKPIILKTITEND